MKTIMIMFLIIVITLLLLNIIQMKMDYNKSFFIYKIQMQNQKIKTIIDVMNENKIKNKSNDILEKEDKKLIKLYYEFRKEYGKMKIKSYMLYCNKCKNWKRVNEKIFKENEMIDKNFNCNNCKE